MIGRDYWQDPANRTDANWNKFFHAMCCELCNRQHNIRDVGYAHLAEASHVDGVDPYLEKERFENVCCYLDMTPGEKPIPTTKEKLRLYYSLYPKPWRTLFSNVPRVEPHGEHGYRGKIHA